MLFRSEYVEILEKLINTTVSKKLGHVIRRNEDIYNDLLTAIMTADWKFEQDNRGHTENYGFRRNMFLWTLGKTKREFTKPENHYYQCANFDNYPDYRWVPNDVNMFFEDFRQAILKCKKLTKKERKYLVGKFVEMQPVKDIASRDNQVIIKHLNNGIEKLKGGYGIFKLERISKHC